MYIHYLSPQNKRNGQEKRITTLDEDIASIRQEVVSTPIDAELTVEQLFEQVLGSATEILDQMKAWYPGTECTRQAEGITNVSKTNEQQEENLPVENITHSKEQTVLASNSINLNGSVEPLHRAEEHWKPHVRTCSMYSCLENSVSQDVKLPPFTTLFYLKVSDP
ncbi:uncharacterized protein LOC125680002 [Ostrea edulis]|uniref:uncharacterized protein LOC125680002 n=1 Tax=Ostrea edulis TaxID=37623 RepID=UPI0024AF9425|nr:uncharacterized protein LOC125680002 [Ostrea edulis]